MKKTLIGALAIALALIGAGCKKSSQNNINNDLTKPIVTAQGINGGGALQLTWDEQTNARYEITAGTAVDTTDSTYFNLTTPVASAVVVAFSGNNRSDPDTVVCSKVVSSTVEFYNSLDSTHANGFGFDSSGAAIAYSYFKAEKTHLDFIAQVQGVQTKLLAPGTDADKAGDQIKDATGNYDSLAIADSVWGTAYKSDSLFAGSAYFLRRSANDTLWLATDHYAKMRVDSIVGAKVSITTTYQMVGGLRWLK